MGILLGVTAAALGGWLLFAAGAFRGAARLFANVEVYASSTRQIGILAGLLIITLVLVWLDAVLVAGRPNRSRIPAWSFPALLALLAFADLYAFGHAFSLGDVSPEQFYPGGAAVQSLVDLQHGNLFRINARRDRQMLLQRNEGLLWNLELLEGYTPLKLADYIGMDIPQERKNDILNVGYRISVDEQTHRMGLVENPTKFPRAMMFHQYRVEPDRAQILTLLRDPSFDFRNILLLEEDPGLTAQSKESEYDDTVIVSRRAPEELLIDVNAGAPGILFVSEIYYPEWHASMDGKAIRILRADYCLRAVPVSAGKHRIVMRFGSRNVITGGLISLLTLAVALVLLAVDRRRPIVMSIRNAGQPKPRLG